ncbi:hypothetical protein BDV33DRAFT_207329 [Aspergillus novoparasiticus]|uniref:Aminoglycoside phosphotransferase domain-containing protein n=1 Tax=Aspergillus novoparasiticus TaxID=986946 RepID=A0A5N6EGF9_9EURO|nr:hypothetical protein BDV33DRAFT_207329 [Aspergillus novoparasiticus]
MDSHCSYHLLSHNGRVELYPQCQRLFNYAEWLYCPDFRKTILGKERLQNDAEVLRFIRRVSNIPVPQLYGAFEIDGSYLLIMEYIDGISMSQLSEVQKEIVNVELQQHLDALHGIESKTIGGPSGIVIPPYRLQPAIMYFAIMIFLSRMLSWIPKH